MAFEGTEASHRTLYLVAGGGALVIGAIVLFDYLANRGKNQAAAAAAAAQAQATGANTTQAGTSPNGSSVTNIESYTNDSTTSNTTSNQYTPPPGVYGGYPVYGGILPMRPPAPVEYYYGGNRQGLPPYVPGGFAQPLAAQTPQSYSGAGPMYSATLPPSADLHPLGIGADYTRAALN